MDHNFSYKYLDNLKSGNGNFLAQVKFPSSSDGRIR